MVMIHLPVTRPTMVHHTDGTISFTFTLPGRARPAPRPVMRVRALFAGRIVRRFVVNPARRSLDACRQMIQAHIDEVAAAENAVMATPMFPRGAQLFVEITFRMKPTLAERQEDPQGLYTTSGGDIDNLAKFYLDAMQSTVYANDKKAVHLNTSKVRAPAVWNVDEGRLEFQESTTIKVWCRL